jgi:peroxin-7
MKLAVMQTFDHPDAVFDCSWTEFNDNLLISACGDGSILLWDIKLGKLASQIGSNLGEVHCVECGFKNPNVFLSSGMDGIVRLWDIQLSKMVLAIPAHKGCAYQATWHPQQDSLFASAGNDGILRIWDLKNPK